MDSWFYEMQMHYLDQHVEEIDVVQKKWKKPLSCHLFINIFMVLKVLQSIYFKSKTFESRINIERLFRESNLF